MSAPSIPNTPTSLHDIVERVSAQANLGLSALFDDRTAAEVAGGYLNPYKLADLITFARAAQPNARIGSLLATFSDEPSVTMWEHLRRGVAAAVVLQLRDRANCEPHFRRREPSDGNWWFLGFGPRDLSALPIGAVRDSQLGVRNVVEYWGRSKGVEVWYLGDDGGANFISADLETGITDRHLTKARQRLAALWAGQPAPDSAF